MHKNRAIRLWQDAHNRPGATPDDEELYGFLLAQIEWHATRVRIWGPMLTRCWQKLKRIRQVVGDA